MAKVQYLFVLFDKFKLILIVIPFFVLKIFSDMHRSNVVNVLSSIKVYPLTVFPHYLHPNNTLFLNGNDDNNDDYDGTEEGAFVPTLGIRSTYPVKLQLPTDINSIVQRNIVLKLVQQKNDYINDIERLIGNYKRASQYQFAPITFDILFN